MSWRRRKNVLWAVTKKSHPKAQSAYKQHIVQRSHSCNFWPPTQPVTTLLLSSLIGTSFTFFQLHFLATNFLLCSHYTMMPPLPGPNRSQVLLQPNISAIPYILFSTSGAKKVPEQSHPFHLFSACHLNSNPSMSQWHRRRWEPMISCFLLGKRCQMRASKIKFTGGEEQPITATWNNLIGWHPGQPLTPQGFGARPLSRTEKDKE